MTEFNYGDVIEYIDDTFDENMEAAKKWAREHNTMLEELIDKRSVQGNIMYRYFQIGSNLQSAEPTTEEKANSIRGRRDFLIRCFSWRIERYKSQQEIGVKTTDSDETYMAILHYLQYLRDLPEQDEFPDIEVLTFEQWQNND